jgi:hypothetical protein
LPRSSIGDGCGHSASRSGRGCDTHGIQSVICDFQRRLPPLPRSAADDKFDMVTLYAAHYVSRRRMPRNRVEGTSL